MIIIYNITLEPKLENIWIEIIPWLLMMPVYVYPIFVLLLIKEFKHKFFSWFVWAYPLVFLLGLINIYTYDDPVGGGLPMVLIVIPFGFISNSILIWGSKRKTN